MNLVSLALASPLSSTSQSGTRPVLASRAEPELRRQRVLVLREAIESGEYHVSAAELADAVLRVARRAN